MTNLPFHQQLSLELVGLEGTSKPTQFQLIVVVSAALGTVSPNCKGGKLCPYSP